MDWVPYCGVGSTPADVWARWNFDPILLAVIAVSVLCIGWRGDVRRGWLGLAVLLLLMSFVSPLCALSSALFSARTVYHLILVAGVAPALALAWSRSVGGLAVATAVQTVVFWVWHAPAAYGAALSNDAIYWLMQLSLLGSAVWFWGAVRAASAPAAVAALVLTTVQMGLLGALIAFAGQPLYAPHLLTTGAWGLTPLEDQQIAGLTMWAPALGLYLAAALWRLARLIGPDAARTAS
jgi:putative membrane protein